MDKTRFTIMKTILDELYESNNINGVEWYSSLAKLINIYEIEKQ